MNRKWWVLGVIGIAQLMVILDNSIVNIALPSAQAELGFTDAQRQWVVTAYALAFGSLLLLGGRMSDLYGRKAAFAVGLTGFGVVSVLGGFASDFGLLVAARALQGVFGALLAPAALSLLTVTFPEGRERTTAFGVFSGLAASGAATGLLLGGTLTQYVDWRWCLYVNAVFAAVALTGALVLLPKHPPGQRPRLDLLGTVTASAGLFGLVFGFATAETAGWGSPTVYVFFGAGLVVLLAFVLIQRRVASPLLPLRVLLHRHRGGAYLTIFVLMTGMFATGLFLAYIMQEVLGFSPVLTGLAFLPQVAGVAVASNTVPRLLLPRLGPQSLLAVGVLILGGGLFWFSFLTTTSSYATDILGPFVLLGLGLGTALSTGFNTATLGVAPQDSGVASAMANTMQQVGGSVGTALLSSIAGTATAVSLAGGVTPHAAALHGYDFAFRVAAVIFVVGAVVIGILVPRGRAHHAQHAAVLALTGRVTGDVAGAATVTLINPVDGAQVDRVVADQDGRFRVQAHRPGVHLILMGADGAHPRVERVTLGDNGFRHDLWLELDGEPGR